MFLTDVEICELTRKKRWSAQARELITMGLPFRRRSDGSIVISAEDIHATKKTGSPSPKLRLPQVR